MSVFNLGIHVFASLNRNGWLLFLTRALRMYAFGSTGVILALYLSAVGLPDERIGVLMTGTLVGDAFISLLITLLADRFGRRRMLLIGCGLKLVGAGVFAYVSDGAGLFFWVLLAGATLGVISPSGNEVGPFMALEQSMLTDQIDPSQRTNLFAWYNLLGYCTTALGSLSTGFLTGLLVDKVSVSMLDAYRITFAQYGCLAALIALLTLCLTRTTESAAWQAAHKSRTARPAIEDQAVTEPLLPDEAQQDAAEAGDKQAAAVAVAPAQAGLLGLSKESRPIVLKLSLLFSMDSFAGGLVTGSLLAYYFHVRFQVSNAYLGGLLFVANIIAGVSSLAAGWVASKIGLINTMVCTHLPSNVLLMLVPVMPTLELATVMVFARFSISQMDVAPRQSYVSGIVPAHERTATMGITNIVKSLGAALGPCLTGYLAANNLFNWAFYLGGGIKILYDLLLLWSFSSLKADHERGGGSARR